MPHSDTWPSYIMPSQGDRAEAEGASKRHHSEQKCLREGEKRQVVLAAASKRGRGFPFLRSKPS
ncbi:rCG38986 [Rattus norvegicus]|uniref:RCG38986 n=1 Tax=Rattus norvegicus TaxID=10116 RepID=A6KQ92_RAT|nr:rCG38986 [Rattus norvegicus]